MRNKLYILFTIILVFIFMQIFIGIMDINIYANPEPGTSQPTAETVEIAIDGNRNDWNNISSLGTGDTGLDNMYAIMDDDNLYIMVEGEEVKGADNFYIDTDFNGDTGHEARWWSELGAEFILEEGNIFKYERGRLNGNGVYTRAKNSSILEVKVPLSALGMTEPGNLRIGYYSQWGKYFIPSKGKDGFVVSYIIGEPWFTPTATPTYEPTPTPTFTPNPTYMPTPTPVTVEPLHIDWDDSFGTSDFDDYFSAIQKISDTEYAVVGRCDLDFDFGSGAPYIAKMELLRPNTNGEILSILWDKKF
jgi:hypothetical protein